jgi:excisionase family DNA binding protein
MSRLSHLRRSGTQQVEQSKNPEWLGTSPVAQRLGCSVETVRQLCLSGKLPSISIGAGERRHYRVHVDAIETFLRSRTLRAAPPVCRQVIRRPERDLLGL